MAEMKNINTENLLSKPWQKFLSKFSEIDVLQKSQWKEVHVLAYICKRYQDHFGHKFALTFRGAPSKCVEIYMTKKIIAMLDTSNMKTVQSYIDWVFDEKVISKKLNFRTLGFFTTPGFANEFLSNKKSKEKITKTTTLPVEYKQVAEMFELEVLTYGDLAFIQMALEADSTSESRAPYKKLFHHLTVIGFDSTVLNNLV